MTMNFVHPNCARVVAPSGRVYDAVQTDQPGDHFLSVAADDVEALRSVPGMVEGDVLPADETPASAPVDGPV